MNASPGARRMAVAETTTREVPLKLRSRLTYANVIASLALFLALGGASALAATQLARNSVGTKQLKNGAVAAAKIKQGAITTSKIGKEAVTGAQLNLATIGKVPSAAKADSATNATNAANAGNANTVGGNTVRKFFYATNATAQKTTILTLDGLTITAGCEGGEVSMVGTTNARSEIHTGGTFLEHTAFYVEDDEFEPGDEFNFLEEETDSVQGTFTYAQPSGAVVTGTFLSEEFAFGSSAEVECLVSGEVIG